MKFSQGLKQEYLQVALTAFVLLIVTVFFTAQPIHRSLVIDSASALWLIGLAFLPHYLRNKRFHKNELILYGLGALVFGVCLLSLLMSPYFDGGLKVLEPELRFLLFPLSIIAIRYSNLSFQHLALVLFLGSIAYTYITYSSHAFRVSGDENAVTFGNGAILLAVLSACLAYFEKNKILKLLLVLSTIGYFYASYRAGTRGSFIIFIPLSFFFLYFLNNKMRLGFIALLILGGITISQSPIGAGMSRAADNTVSYFFEDKVRTNTGLRLHMWGAAFCLVQERPILGIGTHKYKEATQDHESPCKLPSYNRKGYFTQAHSLYFNTLATVGILGLSSILAFFILVARFSWSLPLIAKITIPAVLITFLSYSLTVDLLFHRYIIDKHLTLLAILLGLALNLRENKQADAA